MILINNKEQLIIQPFFIKIIVQPFYIKITISRHFFKVVILKKNTKKMLRKIFEIVKENLERKVRENTQLGKIT